MEHLIWIVPMILYVCLGIITLVAEHYAYKQHTRIAYNPKTGKIAYSYTDDEGNTNWIEKE